MSDFLSQEEIDALLGGGKKQETVEELKVKPFDFSKVEKIQKGGFPGLEIIFERWAKLFREEIRKIFPTITMVSKSKIYISRYGNYISKIPLPAAYSIFYMKPLKESALLVIDARLVFSLVSSIFGGGSKTFKIEGRDFTKLELRIVNDLINVAMETFNRVWEEFYPVQIELKNLELNPFLVRIVSQAEKVIVVEMDMDIDGTEVPFSFCFPQMMFLPIKDLVFSETFGSEVSQEWKQTIFNKLMKVVLTLSVELDRKSFTVEEFLNFEVGNSIILNKKKDSFLDCYIEDRKKFLVKLGKIDKKFAVNIEKKLEEREDG
ncbi:MAG: flagellar motor switch protein FliM [Hydrogenothermaceae bacterium]|nr:flagellar motor switch protein FliM [Hydrogenothermaceae bacterium]